MKRLAPLAFLCLLAITACSTASERSGRAESTPLTLDQAPDYPGTEAGLRELLRDTRADGATDVIRSLRPTTADYRTLFEESFAARAEKMYSDELWSNPVSSLPAKPGQTEINIEKATTDDIKEWNSHALSLPGGYKGIGPYLKSGLTIYKWEYNEPGSVYGMSYNGLVNVNGHWIWVPSPWQVLDEQPS